MQHPQSTDPTMYRWAGESSLAPRTDDPFPTRAFYRWILVGLAGFVLLAGLYLYLERRASRQIIYLTPDNALGMVRADGTGAHKLNFAGLAAYNTRGQPQWSPQGGRFASIIEVPSGNTLLIASRAAQLLAQISLAESVAPELLSEAWAPSGNHVAMISQRAGGTELQIADLEQQRLLSITQPLADHRVSWHPLQDQLLVTTLSKEYTQTIQIVNMNAQELLFNPEDGFAHHSQAAWSPDGVRIAYVASASLNSPEQPLFVANANASSPVKIVADGKNYFPIWAPRGDLIIFTRHNSETNEFMLYRVRPDGEGLAPIGRGLPPEIAMGDPQGAISWSLDRKRMIFQSFNPSTGQTSLSLADYDGSNPSSLVPELTARWTSPSVIWSPTSRGVLVASDGEIWMRWLNSQEREIFASGVYPHWEP